jgi:lysophospholipase L1-like esterase
MAAITPVAASLGPFSLQCYGDSLTAGYKSTQPFHPYALALGAALKGAAGFDIRHKGLPGWTAKELLEEKDSSDGLEFLLKETPAEIAIILAGTNDLGGSNDENKIVEDIWGLHQIAHTLKAKTIAISVKSVSLDFLLFTRISVILESCSVLGP